MPKDPQCAWHKQTRCAGFVDKETKETHTRDKNNDTGRSSKIEGPSNQSNQINSSVHENNNKQNGASSVPLSCWQRTINYGLPASLSLFGTLCVSTSVFVQLQTACHSRSLAAPPTARPPAGCHPRVPACSLTVWGKCLGYQNRPESWVRPG